MKRRGITLFASLLAIVLVLGITGAALAAPPATREVCPEGDGWSDHQDPPLSSVSGADEYCVKGGSSNSEGCTGYLVIGSFSEVQAAVNAPGACGLSHWSWHEGPPPPTDTPEPPTATPTDTSTPETPEDPTATPTITETPKPTETPTEGPSPTPTDTPTATATNVPGQPTPTSPSPPREEPKTGPGDALPIAGFAAFLVLLVIARAGLRFALKRS